MICVVAWVQCLFDMLLFYNVDFIPQIMGSANGVVYEMFLCLYVATMGGVPRQLLIRW